MIYFGKKVGRFGKKWGRFGEKWGCFGKKWGRLGRRRFGSGGVLTCYHLEWRNIIIHW